MTNTVVPRTCSHLFLPDVWLLRNSAQQDPSSCLQVQVAILSPPSCFLASMWGSSMYASSNSSESQKSRTWLPK